MFRSFLAVAVFSLSTTALHATRIIYTISNTDAATYMPRRDIPGQRFHYRQCGSRQHEYLFQLFPHRGHLTLVGVVNYTTLSSFASVYGGTATNTTLATLSFTTPYVADTTNPILAGLGSVQFTGSYSGVGTSSTMSTGSTNYDGYSTGGLTLTVAPATAVAPEPSSLALLGTGILGVAGAIRRRFKR